MSLRLVVEALVAAVRLDELDLLVRAAGHGQVGERLVVHGEEAAGRAVLGRHVRDRRAVGHGEPDEAGPEVLDELPDDAGGAQDLGDREDEVGRGRALAQRAREPEAHDLGDEHRHRLAEQRRLGLDAADAPAEHAEPVHHRRVRVGADERVGERLEHAVLVPALDDAREVLQVHLVADAGVRRRHLEVVEGALAPAQERVALAVSLVVAVDVRADREPRRELVHLDGVVDDELRGDERVDLGRVAAAVEHRVSHRGEVDDRGDAGEVLQQHSPGPKRDLTRGLGLRIPRRDRLDVGVASVPEHVLEQHAQRVRKPEDVEPRLERRQGEDLRLAGRGRGDERPPSLVAPS